MYQGYESQNKISFNLPDEFDRQSIRKADTEQVVVDLLDSSQSDLVVNLDLDVAMEDQSQQRSVTSSIFNNSRATTESV